MNIAIMMGRLTRDPEIRYAQGQQSMAIASFSLAVDRRFKRDNESDADFFNCTAFGKTAEFVEKYLKKGTKVLAQGRIQNDNYKDKIGNTVYAIKFMVETVEFAESKGKDSDTPPSNAPAAPDGFMNIPDNLGSEVPFV